MIPSPDHRGQQPCGHEHDDGAYVLGALSPDDRLAFERHLAACPACARSVRELAGLPGLLARVPVEILDPEQPPVAVPESLLPALVQHTRRAARRRAWVTGGLAAAAAAVVVGAVGVAALGWGDDEAAPQALQGGRGAVPRTADPRPMQPLDPEVSGSVSLTSVGWGTRLDLTCRYSHSEDEPAGYREEPAPTYALFVTRTDGTTEQVASWKGLPDKTMHLAAATAADTEDVASVEVRSSDGATVLELDS